MAREVPEADWKIFRRIREDALERFCGQVLDDVTRMCAGRSGTAHECYLEVFSLLRERDRQLASAFDYLSRSRMIEQLAVMTTLGLLNADDLRGMSHETQEKVRLLARYASGNSAM